MKPGDKFKALRDLIWTYYFPPLVITKGTIVKADKVCSYTFIFTYERHSLSSLLNDFELIQEEDPDGDISFYRYGL